MNIGDWFLIALQWGMWGAVGVLAFVLGMALVLGTVYGLAVGVGVAALWAWDNRPQRRATSVPDHPGPYED